MSIWDMFAPQQLTQEGPDGELLDFMLHGLNRQQAETTRLRSEVGDLGVTINSLTTRVEQLEQKLRG